MKAFKTLQHDEDAISRFQDNVQTSFQQVMRSLIIDGVLIRDMTLTTGKDNVLNHKLGRKALMCIIAKQDTNTNVWQADSTDQNNTLILHCGANCTVSVWVA